MCMHMCVDKARNCTCVFVDNNCRTTKDFELYYYLTTVYPVELIRWISQLLPVCLLCYTALEENLIITLDENFA